jgi:hypothetical protein
MLRRGQVVDESGESAEVQCEPRDDRLEIARCGMVSAKTLRAAAVKACMLGSRSAPPVSNVVARSAMPATAKHVWPAGSP